MVVFPLFEVRKKDQPPSQFELYVVRKDDLGRTQPGGPFPLPPKSAVLLESDSQPNDAPASSTTTRAKNALRNGEFQRLIILSPATHNAQWFIISFLTIPPSKLAEFGDRFQTYLQEIFSNPKFNPVFSYLAPLHLGSDVLLSVWGYNNSRDAGVYMPSAEHVAFGNSVASFITHAEFFEATVVNFNGARL